MPHSLRSYLRKQSTETLGELLRSSVQEEINDIVADRIRIILDILDEREENAPPLPPEEEEYLTQLWETIINGPAR